MMAPLLITGANGFIGISLISHLVKMGETNIVATYRDNQEALAKLPTNQVRLVACDLSDPVSVSKLFEDYNIGSIVHLAAAVPGRVEGDFSSIAERDNIQSVKNLLQMAVTKGCKRFIFTSAIGVYDGIEKAENGLLESVQLSPTSIFGQSKLAGEKLIEQSTGDDLEAVSLRFPGVHGPGKNKGVIYNFLKAALAQASLNIQEPDSINQLLFIDDAIQAILLSLNEELPDSYCCYNVAGKEIFSVLEIARSVLEVTKSKSILNVTGSSILKNQVLNIEKIQEDLSFKPFPFQQHLLPFIDFLEGKGEQCV